MKGHRDDYSPDQRDRELPTPGAFGKWYDGWYGCTPNGHMCGLRKHGAVEHEDGTITVSPSILVSNADGELWHGYLERGVWRQV